MDVIDMNNVLLSIVAIISVLKKDDYFQNLYGKMSRIL